MLYKNDSDKDINNCLVDWPSAYYKEEDAYDRKDMLDFAEEHQAEDDMLETRRKLWQRRYEEKRGSNFPVDRFVRGIVVGKTIMTSSSNFLGLGAKRNQKLLGEVMSDLAMDLYQQEDEPVREVIRQEWKQLASLYLKLCVEDKNFSTGILSMFKLSDEELLGKVADEVVLFCYQVPMLMNVEEQFHDFAEIFTKTYEGTFRNGEKIIRKKIDKIMEDMRKNRQ